MAADKTSRPSLKDFLSDADDKPFQATGDGKLLVADLDLLKLIAEYLQQLNHTVISESLEADSEKP